MQRELGVGRGPPICRTRPHDPASLLCGSAISCPDKRDVQHRNGQAQHWRIVRRPLSSRETVNAGMIEYITSKNRWQVTGTTRVAANHTMTLHFTDVVAGSALRCRRVGDPDEQVSDWELHRRHPNATGSLDPRTADSNAVRVESAVGGIDPTPPIRLK
jgi:hypothetical protein